MIKSSTQRSVPLPNGCEIFSRALGGNVLQLAEWPISFVQKLKNPEHLTSGILAVNLSSAGHCQEMREERVSANRTLPSSASRGGVRVSLRKTRDQPRTHDPREIGVHRGRSEIPACWAHSLIPSAGA